ncbi:unnamed protein product [Darwinula stevensoni]|uniref:DUF7789 domain-containing protein n=1 Tax=Darwinula stevensoni TaxID=69355 RepID=A0A7R9ABD5_9CRUS|nr:unnamed protein product [Darwinula stevensoni]CAG0899162.1 unnamed protein product [Darwinula stevensoni]
MHAFQLRRVEKRMDPHPKGDPEASSFSEALRARAGGTARPGGPASTSIQSLQLMHPGGTKAVRGRSVDALAPVESAILVALDSARRDDARCRAEMDPTGKFSAFHFTKTQEAKARMEAIAEESDTGQGEGQEKRLSEQRAKFGLPSPSKIQRSPLLGVIRSYNQVAKGEWVYLVVAHAVLCLFRRVGGTIFSLVLTIMRFVTLEKSSDDYPFAIIMFISTLFCAFFVVYGVWREQPFSLLVYIVATIVVLVYVIMNFVSSNQREVQTIEGTPKLLRLVVTSCLSAYLIPVGFYYAYRYWDSQKFIYDLVGPEPRRMRALNVFFAFQSLLWFDLLVELSLEVMIMRHGILGLDHKEVLVLAVGCVLSIGMRLLGYLAVRYENPKLCLVYAVLGLLPLGYVISLFYDAYETLDPSSTIYKTILFTGSVMLVMKVILLWMVFLSYRNFGMGILQWVYGDPVVRQTNVKGVVEFKDGE